eukprot:1144499-Pelagomonas_calceolata.AAC.1
MHARTHARTQACKPTAFHHDRNRRVHVRKHGVNADLGGKASAMSANIAGYSLVIIGGVAVVYFVKIMVQKKSATSPSSTMPLAGTESIASSNSDNWQKQQQQQQQQSSPQGQSSEAGSKADAPASTAGARGSPQAQAQQQQQQQQLRGTPQANDALQNKQAHVFCCECTFEKDGSARVREAEWPVTLLVWSVCLPSRVEWFRHCAWCCFAGKHGLRACKFIVCIGRLRAGRLEALFPGAFLCLLAIQVDRVDCMQQLPERTCLDPTLLFVPGIESKQAVAYVHSAALRVRRKYRAVLTCLPVYCMVSNARWQKFQSNAA